MSSGYSLCVCLCIYKSEDGLPYVLANLHKIMQAGIFTRVKIIAVYEEADTDAASGGGGGGSSSSSSSGPNHSSCALLKSFSNHVQLPNSLELVRNQYPTTHIRQRNIGNARNTFLNRMRELRGHPTIVDADADTDSEAVPDIVPDPYDYFAMMDANNYSCIGPVDTDVLRNAMNCADSWDSLSFLREAGYYDFWALSFDPFIRSFFHFKMNWGAACGKMREAFKEFVESGLASGMDLFPVYSAFNGFALYRSAIYLSEDLRYSDEIDPALFPPDVLKKQVQLLGCDPDDRTYDDCEHRFFHLASKQSPHNARIYIYSRSLFNEMPVRDRPTRFQPRAPV